MEQDTIFTIKTCFFQAMKCLIYYYYYHSMNWSLYRSCIFAVPVPLSCSMFIFILCTCYICYTQVNKETWTFKKVSPIWTGLGAPSKVQRPAIRVLGRSWSHSPHWLRPGYWQHCQVSSMVWFAASQVMVLPHYPWFKASCNSFFFFFFFSHSSLKSHKLSWEPKKKKKKQKT